MSDVFEIWLGDSLTIDVPVVYAGGPLDGQPVDLTGATVVASAGRRGTTVAGTATLTDAAGGIINVAFAPGAINVSGRWTVQVKVTLAGQVQTVLSDEFVVNRSLI